jgi:V/A-type H+-transporting ATPase subunit G/H
MERVLGELKRIEDEAEKIRSEASEKSQEIIETARQKARELTADAENEAEKELEKFLKKFKEEMEVKQREVLKATKIKIDGLNRSAKKNVNLAVDEIFKIVVGAKEG